MAAGVLIYASYSLTDSYLGYKEDEAKYAAINKMFEQKETGGSNAGGLSYSSKTTKWKWNYKAMRKYNNESVGYIKLDGTRIQYPIVAHNDNIFYLYHGSDKVSNNAGAIFVDYRCEGLEGEICVVYGHNMLDGSMFSDLMKYKKIKFCRNHQVFDIYIGNHHYKYYVFSSFSARKTNEHVYKFGFRKEKDYAKWIKFAKKESNFKYKHGTPTTKDKVLMLSTCADDYGTRELVCLYRGEEVVD